MAMDPEGDSQPTQQATQDVLDPRRLGKQNSGFSDEEISDIICLLIPASETARRETKRIAVDTSNPMIAWPGDAVADFDYNLDDEAGRFGLMPQGAEAQQVIVLRLSALVKNPAHGFTFGRNPSRCDICFVHDPLRRLSNVHFRIYLNDYGVLMLEDMSTNGTVVDEKLLKAKPSKGQALGTKRTLSSGSKIRIPMHEPASDLDFYVRIPRREGEYERAYRYNLAAYTNRLAQRIEDENRTIGPGPGGHVDLFPQVATGQRQASNGRPGADGTATRPMQASPEEPLPLAWNGSNKYNRIGEIGKGAFATVYKVTSKFDGLPYAAKELDRRRFMKNGVLDQKVENEMTIMKRINHPNIVRYVEQLEWDNRLLIIIMEYVPGGDLGRLILDKGRLAEAEVTHMGKQLLEALAYLHVNNITHRDVKPDNILIASLQPLTVKLTDFGLSKMVDNEQTFLRTFCGTLLYCAPEVYSEFSEYDIHGRRVGRHMAARKTHQRRRYDHAIDVWSLGGVLFYAMSGSPPYPARNGISYSELLHQIMTKRLNITPLLEANVSADGTRFLSSMLERRPELRATVKDLLKHRWVGGPGLDEDGSIARSDDEVSDEEQLQLKASQLSLVDEQRRNAAHIGGTGLLFRPDDDDGAIPSVLLEEAEREDEDDAEESIQDSQKENYTLGHDNPQPRLFGEVDMNLSAIGSSGVIPTHRLNLPMSASSFDIEVADSYASENQSTPQLRSQPRSDNGGVRLSESAAGRSRSIDQLNNLTFDESSQDLGGAESILENLNMKSLGGSHLHYKSTDFNTSKRRASLDTSDEHEADGSVVRDKPTFKRIKSDGYSTSAPGIDEEELVLFSRIPSVARPISGRLIDLPVHKATFWTVDKGSWHLRYPEMTQLQLDAFRSAAQAMGEEFLPGQTQLWAMACKYFPPSYLGEGDGGGGDDEARGVPLQDSPTLGDLLSPVPYSLDAVLGGQASLPLTQLPDAGTSTLYGVSQRRGKRTIATVRSSSDSDVQDISICMSEAMVSWGRAPHNTCIYPHRTESAVPKSAFKIMLWREDYDPSRNRRPWARTPTMAQGDSFAFYISTKATGGIYVNNFPLHSHDYKNPHSPSRNWLQLYDGDVIDVWRRPDGGARTRLVFSCSWSSSAQRRPRSPSPGDVTASLLVPEATAQKLDEACLAAESRLRSRTERDMRMEEADHDVDLRLQDAERERSLAEAFERRRAEACRVLKARTSRRQSPAGMGVGMPSAAAAHLSSTGTSITVTGGAASLRGGPGVGVPLGPSGEF